MGVAVPHGPQRQGGLWEVLWEKSRFRLQGVVPHFANWRRDGYDFDSRWEDELAPMRQKRIMDCFSMQEEWFSFALKQRASFGKGGEKNFEGTVTDLQMGGYLLIRDFRQRINKRGAPTAGPSPSTPPQRSCGDMTTSPPPILQNQRNLRC